MTRMQEAVERKEFEELSKLQTFELVNEIKHKQQILQRRENMHLFLDVHVAKGDIVQSRRIRRRGAAGAGCRQREVAARGLRFQKRLPACVAP